MMSIRSYLYVLVGLVVAAMVAGSGMARAAGDRNTLFAYWPFEEGEGDTTADAITGDHEGILTGGTKWVDGKFGNGIEFNGSDGFVDIPTMVGMEAFEEGTIEFWVNPEAWDEFDNLVGMQSAANNINTIRLERTWPDVDSISVYVGDGAGNYGVTGTLALLEDGDWSHVVFTWIVAEDKAATYLNGKKIPAKLTTWPDEYAAMRIGTGYAGRWTHGVIDEVRLWKSALTPEEVTANMTVGTAWFLAVSPQGKLATTWASMKASD